MMVSVLCDGILILHFFGSDALTYLRLYQTIFLLIFLFQQVDTTVMASLQLQKLPRERVKQRQLLVLVGSMSTIKSSSMPTLECLWF